MTTNPNEAAEFENFLACLLENYPRRDALDEARSALRDVFGKSTNTGQTKCLLLTGAAAYEHETCERGSTAFLRLDDFIRGESWTAENLPFNVAAAA